MEELKINVGTGNNSPILVKIDSYEYDSNEYPISFEVEAQFLRIHWHSSYVGFDKGFSGTVEIN